MSESRREVEEKVAQACREILARRDDRLELDRVEYAREGQEWYVRVFLDHPDGVTLDHCQEVARALGETLDAADPIPHAYRLEVSSPGLERPLRETTDYDRFKGRLATLYLYRSVRGKKVLTGRLGGLDDADRVVLDLGAEGTVELPRREIAKAHLAVDWSGIPGRTASPASDDRMGGGDR